MDDLLAQLATKHGVIGAQLAVAGERDTVITTYGTADLARPVTPETPFQIASVTKPMLAMVVSVLAEEGALSFEDPVTEHVPELREHDWARKITLRHLMANNAGLPLTEQREFSFQADDDATVLAHFATDLATTHERPFWPPDTTWSYSNTAWCLLGRAIETVTNLDWESAMQGLLFEPLGLSRTTFRTFDPDINAHHYVIVAGQPEPIAIKAWHARALGPAGAAVWSTAEDVATFARALMHDRFAHLREAHADVAVPHFADKWCLGMARFDWSGGPAWGWDGVGAGHRAIMRIIPSKSAAYVLLTNSTTGRLLYRELFTELLRDVDVTVPPIDTTARAVSDVQRYAGTYAWPDRTYEVTAREGQLFLMGDRERALTPVNEHLFIVEGAPEEAPMVRFDNDALYQLVWAYPRIDPTS